MISLADGGRGRPLLVVLRALKLGDFLTAVPALRALHDEFPDHRRVLAAPGWLAPLAKHAGSIDALSPTPGLVPLDPRLADPEVAVDLHGRGPGSQPLLLALRPRRLIAFAHPEVPATAGGPKWRRSEHEVARWCRLLVESGIPADPGRLDLATPARTVPAWVKGATLIHPGAASAARRWPATRYAAVARAEQRRGREVVVTGGPGEADLATRTGRLGAVPPDRVVFQGLGLLDLLALVASAGRVVCGDTGVAHVATAVGTPSVVLFGPVPPGQWGPPADRPWHRPLWAGRRGDPHGATVDAGLLRISPDQVITALEELPCRAGGAGKAGAPSVVRAPTVASVT
ncbi:MAG TPA: glycosyltransferase family 9 protein [Acidimicrobiales bacterium]|nr:glycosyltransferase family 9 protein [Acidimicrobiales bacterium]